MIDAHQHCWQLGQHDCTWPTPELAAIYRDFVLEDLLPLAHRLGVTGSVLVQSQTSDADTDYLLALAQQSDFVKAVVGWVDLASPGAPARIAQLAQHPKLRGLRPMLQELPEDDWILRPELEPALAAMKQHQLSLDALVYTRHLVHLEVFAKRHPELAIVIDHAAKPAVSAHDRPADDWRSAIATIAQCPNMYCKLSGVVTEAGKNQGEAELLPYLQYLLAVFGSERLMWGSDWPVIHLAPNKHLSSYKNWFSLVNHALAGCKTSDFESVFIGTSLRFYRIT
ncbi:amidohydrolase family protein [Cellvibrio sp. OA-2007]|uniref:amidohydrolase family protein n=1 Tax=Cellvibrio sp. OA-2007 TaxID=529823 RepID=UPI000780D119|nr:amidohydrolase family protein [Cellvibrio sp. OA-2007]